MSVYFYDEAITKRIRDVINDTNVHIIPADVMFSRSKDQNDNPELPAVSLYRSGYSLSTLRKSITGYRQGSVQYDNIQDKIFATRSLPISISYQIDVWTKTREQNDELIRELLWFFTLYPQHQIQISYKNFNRNVTFNCFLGDEVIDNSEITEFENRGQYYRQTFTILVDEAQLFMVAEVPRKDFVIKVQSYSLKGELLDESIFTSPFEEGV